MQKLFNFFKCKFIFGNSFCWATNCGCKDLLRIQAQKWMFGLKIKKSIDIGSGESNDLFIIAKKCEEYHFLDNFKLPKPGPAIYLHKQSVVQKINVPDNYFDLVISNGSFDHFKQRDREACFLEIERTLKPNGRLLFACEYFDFETDNHFKKAARDQDLKKANCNYYDNINLKKIVKSFKNLKLIQNDCSNLPDGRPLRKIIDKSKIKIFTSQTKYGLQNIWGSFFCVFVKK